MAVIKRANVAPPVLPKETVEVEALGGEVVVQGLLLSDRQDLEAYMVALARAGREAAEGGAAAQAPGMAKVMPRLLHLSVLDADGERIYTEQEWQALLDKNKRLDQRERLLLGVPRAPTFLDKHPGSSDRADSVARRYRT